VDALADAVRVLRPGDPAVYGVAVGPVISEAARARILDAVTAAKAAGGRIIVGGGVPDLPGWFVDPVLVENLPVNHPLLCEETFGPLMAVQHVRDLDEAIKVVNGVRFGLVTSVHGRDVDALLVAASRLDTGMVKINAPTTGVDFYAPFGGEKASSYGPREQGAAALDFYTSTRTFTFAKHLA